MVRNLKALMYSGSINGANFTSFMGFWGELHGKPRVVFFFTFYIKERQYIHCGNLGEGYNVIAEKIKRQFYKNNNKCSYLKKRNSSEVIQYNPDGRVLLSLELDSVSSSGTSGTRCVWCLRFWGVCINTVGGSLACLLWLVTMWAQFVINASHGLW